MHAITKRTICGQVFWFSAHGGALFLGASDFVALKIVKTVASMATTIKEQEKLTPRSNSLATRTLVLIFYGSSQ